MIFQDWHLVVVMCIFVALHSSKSLLKLCENCETFCLSLCSTESTLSLIRNLIVMCCLSQPFLFCTVYIYKHATQQPLQFVLINTITLNQTSVLLDVVNMGNASAADQIKILNNSHHWYNTHDTSWEFTLRSHYVDYLFFCIPLAIVTCWSSLIWTQLGKEGKLYENQTWDADMIEHVSQYEGVYCVEILTFNLAGIPTTTHGRTSLEMYYTVVACTLLAWNSIPMAYQERDQQLDSWTGLAFILLLIMVLRNVWIHMLFGVCAGTTVVAVIHSVGLSVLCWMHATGSGQRASGTIILLRTLTSLVLNLANLIVFSLGWEAVC